MVGRFIKYECKLFAVGRILYLKMYIFNLHVIIFQAENLFKILNFLKRRMLQKMHFLITDITIF